MPVYLKQWLDGDFTILWAKDRAEAKRILEQTACVDDDTILQLNAGDMSASFTLTDSGELVCREFTPAIAEARQQCFPELMAVLSGDAPELITDPARKALVEEAVNEELTVRKMSKLSQRLLERASKTTRPREAGRRKK